jgi:hypothetical protein
LPRLTLAPSRNGKQAKFKEFWRKKLCLIKTGEAGYPRSVLSRFIRKVGEDNLTRIIEEKVVKLLKRNDAKDVDAVLTLRS